MILVSPTLFGRDFGQLRAFAPDPHSEARWLIRCTCGAVCSLSEPELLSGSYLACSDCQPATPIPSTLWSNLRSNARRRNLRVEVTQQFLFALLLQQRSCCVLSGWPIGFDRKHKRNTASVDRINHKKHYTTTNVQWVHKIVNSMRGVYSPRAFLTQIDEIRKHGYDPDYVRHVQRQAVRLARDN